MTYVNFDWYDSGFLNSIYRITKHCPESRASVQSIVHPLRTSYEFTPQWISIFDDTTQRRIRDRVLELGKHSESAFWGEYESFGRWVVHDDALFTAIQHGIAKYVSYAVGEDVVPSYNFLSMYGENGTMEAHVDHPEAKYTVNHIVDTNTEWPLYVGNVMRRWPGRSGITARTTFTTYTHSIKNRKTTLLFSGSAQWHYRDRIPMAKNDTPPFSSLIFFHFVPRSSQNVTNETRLENIFCPMSDYRNAHSQTRCGGHS